MASILNLIPVVSAQDFDALSQPTFGSIDIGTSNGQAATVLLSSSSTSSTVGSKFKINVAINTGEQQINEFKIVVEYDSTKLSVVDQDSNSTGTQIRLVDTVFTVSNPVTDNVATQTGRITLLASTPSGSSFSVNRNVAEIEFQSQSIGTAGIKVVQGSVGTQLIRSNGAGLDYSPNELSIQILTITEEPETPVTPEPNTPTTPTTPVTPPVTEIPDTAITGFEPLIPISLGLFFMLLGLTLISRKVKKPKKDKYIEA